LGTRGALGLSSFLETSLFGGHRKIIPETKKSCVWGTGRDKKRLHFAEKRWGASKPFLLKRGEISGLEKVSEKKPCKRERSSSSTFSPWGKRKTWLRVWKKNIKPDFVQNPGLVSPEENRTNAGDLGFPERGTSWTIKLTRGPGFLAGMTRSISGPSEGCPHAGGPQTATKLKIMGGADGVVSLTSWRRRGNQGSSCRETGKKTMAKRHPRTRLSYYRPNEGTHKVTSRT